ncbi:MAG: AarF/UbiB family protein [Thermoanaerobaculia bacterium]|jgi:ubiquinone biosynthesis protein
MSKPSSQTTGPDAPVSTGAPPAAAEQDFELYVEAGHKSLLLRLFTIYRHLLGLTFGGLPAYLRSRPRGQRHGLKFWGLRLTSFLTYPFINRKLARLPFPVQLRKRLEALGPTYVKLGQILALRRDVLPLELTDELKNLLERLPALPFQRYVELVSLELDRPVDEMFSWIEPVPMGSASIGQTHRATILDGDSVVIKLVKPGIREIVRQDVMLLRILGSFLQVFLSQYQPKRMIGEFCAYTLKEVDLRYEAENAETFSANFKDMPEVVFPAIYRQFTTESLLVMEYLPGLPPNNPAVQALSSEERDRIIDIGAAAIIQMLYGDGFFHADLHPGNLLVLPGPMDGFIDLGMVGRFDDDLRRTLLYYFYCLVMGDAANAARYLASIAEGGRKSDRKGFRRDVEEICRRWQRDSTFEGFSIAQLIMESVGRAANYRMYLPVEMVLMVKAMVTFEAVGNLLQPGFDVAEVSKPYITQIFINQFSPLRIAQETMRGAPDLVDALIKAPMLVTEGLKVLEQTTQREPENPFAGIRGTVLAGSCLVAGAIVAASHGPWPVWVTFIGAGIILALRGRE